MASMVSQVEQNAQPRPQMLFVGAKDSKRLLEVYVKRSLSLNDGSHRPPQRERRPCKWVTAADRDRRARKHSSDTSLHFKPSSSEEELVEGEAFSHPETERKVESETTDNRSKQQKRKSALSRSDETSAPSTSYGKPTDKHDGRQPDTLSLHPKSLASEEALSKDKALSERGTENETSEKSKQWKKSSLIRKNSTSASQSSDGKPWKRFSRFDKDKQDGRRDKASKQDTEDQLIENSPPPAQPQLESLTEVKKTKEGKKVKKLSIWKSFLGWFSRGTSDKQEEQDDDGRTEQALPTPEPATPPFSCLPVSTGDGIILRHSKSSRRRRSQRKISLKRSSGDMGVAKTTARPLTLDLSTEAHNCQVQSIEEVEATRSYYEKMSEELEKIVNEVKNSPLEENKTFTDSLQPTDTDALLRSQEEIIKRIIDLIKQEGDVINDKLKENAMINSYFNTITYGSFQKLADQYVNSEVPQQTTGPPVVAPELVKFAFTLDFTARVAALSRHPPRHILGFGNQYLKDRFTYLCESHPHIMDITTEKQMALQESSDG